jgi:asparagine synthase (glutamine-hydrolysing)
VSAIAGLWRRRNGPGPEAGCERMLLAQAIYGPDDAARWSDGEMAVGRRLYRLLPEDIHDRGPLTLADGSVLVADLRLDNRLELGVALDLDASRAASLCDAAILAMAWDRWEEGCFDRLAGDYAFAVWSAARRRLFLARDPFGHRPLHYHRGDGWFAFASMPKGLQAVAEGTSSPDTARMAQFLALLPETGPRSFFEGIERVEPGCWAAVTGDEVEVRRHWRPQPAILRSGSADDSAHLLRAQLDRAVSAQLRGAGDEVGAHLSSGWDSTVVAATAARLMAPHGGRVTAFTAAPREGYAGAAPKGLHNDEAPLAAETVALHANMAHVVVRGAPRPILDGVDREALLNDRPMLNLCNRTWWEDINRAAGVRGVRVMLTGDFGNLTITPSGIEQLGELVAKGAWLTWLGQARALARSGALGWPAILATSIGERLPPPVWNLIRRLAGRRPERRIDYVAMPPGRLAAVLRPAHGRGAGPALDPRAAAMQGADLGCYAKGALAAWGVDIRHPATDRRLVELCLSIPPGQLIEDGLPRALARRAFADRVAPAVFAARTRGYQGADWHESLCLGRAEIVEEVERLASCPPAAALLDIDRLRALVRTWPNWGWERDEIMVPYRLALLRAVSAGRFLRRASGANQ